MATIPNTNPPIDPGPPPPVAPAAADPIPPTPSAGSFPASTEVIPDDKPSSSQREISETEAELHDDQREELRDRIERV